MDDAADTPAEDARDEQRAGRPGRRAATPPAAPAWFHGGELDLVGDEERGQLYLDARSRLGPYPWFMIILTIAFMPGMVRGLGTAHAWAWILGAIAWVASIAGSTLMRRHVLRKYARQTLRESPDWPQRLDQGRTPPASTEP